MSLRKKFLKKNSDEIFCKKFWRDVACELVATFCLVSIQSAIALKWTNPDQCELIQYALGVGFVVTVLIEAFAPMGGAHMNPTVTIGFALAGKITISRLFLYLVVQCGGGIAGAAFMYGITPSKQRDDMEVMTLHSDITIGQGVVMEAWLTFILMQTIWGSINSRRRRVLSPSIPIGLAYVVDILAGAGHTGASMNPARALGPAVIMNNWTDHWVYWVGPVCGAVVATVLYHYILDHIAQTELPADHEKEELRSALKDSNGRRTSVGRYQQIYGLSPRNSAVSTIST